MNLIGVGEQRVAIEWLFFLASKGLLRNQQDSQDNWCWLIICIFWRIFYYLIIPDMKPSLPHFPLLPAYIVQGKHLEDTHESPQIQDLDVQPVPVCDLQTCIIWSWVRFTHQMNNYPLHKEERQNSIPLQTLSRICKRCENLEGWLFLHKSLKIWHLRSSKHTGAKRPGSQSQNSCWYYWKIPFMFNGWNLLQEGNSIISRKSNIALWILHGK